MVTIQVNNLIDFVAEVFSHSESSPEEARRIATYLTTANLTGHDSHGVIRVPVYIRWKKTGNVVPEPDPRDRRRYAVARRGRWQVRLWPDRDAVRGADRHREVQEGGAGRRRAAQRRAYRPRRRLGGNGRRRRAGVGALRQRRGLAAGGALWRRAEAAVDRALLRRHSAPGAGSDRARFRHLGRRRRQGAGGKPRRQETADGRAGRCRRHAERGAGGALRALHAGRAARPHQGHRRDPRVRRAQGLGACLHLRTARRRADRHRRHFGRTGSSPTACSPSMSIPR